MSNQVTFTLDHNSFIHLEQGTAEGQAVAAILKVAKRGGAHIAVAVSSASEKILGGAYPGDIDHFRFRMNAVGLGEAPLLQTIAKCGLSYWDWGICPTPDQQAREAFIFRTLFPTIAPEWPDFAALNGLDPEDLTTPGAHKWRNPLCDVQAFWAHDDAERDVFVTTDRRFARKLSRSPEFAAAKVRTPTEAAAML
ncbi:hypothetical protein [Ensifer canadensis]